MNKNEFLEVIKRYKGEITEDNYFVKIVATNNLGGKKVKCEMSYNIKQGFFDGYEQTCSIIGGFGFPKDSFNEEDVVRELERYCFEKKEVEQLSLW